jgi:hypothetical protein
MDLMTKTEWFLKMRSYTREFRISTLEKAGLSSQEQREVLEECARRDQIDEYVRSGDVNEEG